MNYGEIIGYRELNYVSKKTGKPVHGYNICLMADNEQYVGSQVAEIYCSVANLNGYTPKIGDVVVCLYNSYGRVCSVAPRV